MQLLVALSSGTITARSGLALKQTRAQDNTTTTDNSTTPIIERYKPESGMEFACDATLRPDTTWNYTGKCALFTTFASPNVWTIRWENEMRYRVWRFVGLTFMLHVIYDAAQSLHTQFRQGAMITFFAEP